MAEQLQDVQYLNIENGVKEVIFRRGEAAKVYEPAVVNRSGALSAPREYLTGKRRVMITGAIQPVSADVISTTEELSSYNPADATLYVDRDNKKIELQLNEKNAFGDVIKGSLEISQELKDLKINSETRWGVQELKRMFKQIRHMFVSREDHLTILANLEKFNATVTTKLQQESSNRGNSLNSIERAVTGIEWNPFFKLSIPIFKGGPKYTFLVEIAIDPTDAAIRFFLDSPDLYELQDHVLNEAFEKEVAYFSEWGCSVVTIS